MRVEDKIDFGLIRQENQAGESRLAGFLQKLPPEKQVEKDEQLDLQKKAKKLQAAVEGLNKINDIFNYGYRFKIHEATENTMLLVLDTTKHPEKVIKEIPAEKFLDLLARIGESVGALLDEYV